MNKNVFWKSTFRKPLVSILLLVLLGVLSFGFISRVVEYLMVHQEIERISDSLGGLLLGAVLQWIIFPDVGVGKVLVCAGLYLLGSMLGTVLGAIHITRKMPLELLQVKE